MKYLSSFYIQNNVIIHQINLKIASLYVKISYSKWRNFMEIICTSDSHGRIDILRKIYEKHPNADIYLDAGDSEQSENQLFPFISVMGNCDGYVDIRYRIINFKSFKLYIFHGDKALLSLEALAQRAKSHNCNIIIHGHTHTPHYSIFNNVHIICPGSVSLPRSRAGATYAIININDDELNVKIERV